MRVNWENLREQLARNWKKYLSPVLMVLGAVLLFYVGSEYYGMHREQQRLQAEWDQQQKTPTTTEAPKPADDGLIRLAIPKIDLTAIVVDGTTRKQLKNGPGRIVGTPLPGEPGNSVISAHRDTFFRHIYELKAGDEIDVQRNGQALKFEVTGKKIVDPDDLSVLKQTDDAQLTLITCYPTYYIGPAPQRLVVFSKLVSANPKTLAADEGR
jgi:sortase A